MTTLKDVKDGYDNVAEGEYKVEVCDLDKRPSDSGNDCLYWKYEILSGKYQGRMLQDTTSLVESSLWKLKKLIKTLCKEEKYRELLELDVNGGHLYGELVCLKGKQLILTVAHREWPKNSGEMRASVASFKPVVTVDDEISDAIADEEVPF